MLALTARELAALEGQLDRERILAERAKDGAAALRDPQLRAKLEMAAARHREHFSRLLELLC
ncbi:MAG: spore coat protein [Oscillospiraceae bacterium]|nr:spore coat protein [Oscillospiraceae bacterium]